MEVSEWLTWRPGLFIHQERTQDFGAEKISYTTRESKHDSLLVYPVT
jgi:hypothetical protein